MPISPFLMYSATCDFGGCSESLEIHPVELDDCNEWHAQAYASAVEGWKFYGFGSVALCPKHKSKKCYQKVCAEAVNQLKEVSPNKDLLEKYKT